MLKETAVSEPLRDTNDPTAEDQIAMTRTETELTSNFKNKFFEIRQI